MLNSINDSVLDHAKEVVSGLHTGCRVDIRIFSERFFSVLYELSVSPGNISYILKISTTDRSCQNEFDKYEMLSDMGLKTLRPIYYSGEHNYLITKKEEIYDFETIMLKRGKNNLPDRAFFELGSYFKTLIERTAERSVYCYEDIELYTHGRIDDLRLLSLKEKLKLKERLAFLGGEVNCKPCDKVLVTDMALCNMHVSSKGNIYLLDMGDAYKGYCFDLIASLYLSVKYGAFQLYFERKGETKKYFAEFIDGAGLDFSDDSAFSLFQIKHLINMLYFIDSEMALSKRGFRRVLSLLSNKYLAMRFKRYLLRL